MSTPFISVQHQLIIGVVIVYPDHFVYSDHREKHAPHLFVSQPSSSPSLLASSTWHTSFVQVPVYACPMMAAPSRAFVPDVLPGLERLERRIANIDFVRLCMPGASNTDVCFHP
ncbi:Phenylalanine ammonia-lyase [Hordeum vulgare]|nr:Phenylalanine ammonia-lyase [Hordeum vulgare]